MVGQNTVERDASDELTCPKSLKQPVCTDCGGTVIEYDAAAGNGFCVQCGTVIEENTIVNEVSFGETSTGAAMVQGAFVGQGASKLSTTCGVVLVS